ncbi:MAG: hypothetical protein JXA67_21030 [Micromonosporaceae bacterium]|nr:hypothetical protein [Micromonosporaceae bacterium]
MDLHIDRRQAAVATCIAAGTPTGIAEQRLADCDELFAVFQEGEEEDLASLLDDVGYFDVEVALDQRGSAIADCLYRAVAVATAVDGFPSGAAYSLFRHLRGGRLVEAFILLIRVGHQRWAALPGFWTALLAATQLLGAQDAEGYAEARDRCMELARQ